MDYSTHIRRAVTLTILVIGLISVTGLASLPVSAQAPVLLEGDFQVPDGIGSGAAMSTLDASLTRFYQTSEYMVGRVAVGLVLVESDGSIDPDRSNWTAVQQQTVISQVQAALNWWIVRRPGTQLSFVIDDHATIPVTTGYEPIDHPQAAEGLWISDVMAKMGYTTNGYFNRVRTYVNDLRAENDADWAFTIFVVNSNGDPDAAFSDGYFAYAYLGGPFMVMTYDNGNYGIAHMDAVAAHEVGHMFHALDQYASANIPCTVASGYLNVENQNSQRAGCSSDVASIMRGGISAYLTGSLDPSAAGQIGWRDSDSDGILDPIDTTPNLTLTTAVQSGTAWTYAGYALDQPYPSTTALLQSINVISVEYQIDGGDWQSVPSTKMDDVDTSVAYTLTLTNLATGNHAIVLRARNSVGNISIPIVGTAIMPDPVDGGLDTQLTGASANAMAASSQRLISGEATSFLLDGLNGPSIMKVEIQVDDGAWQLAQAIDGNFDSSDEDFTFDVSLAAGMHILKARATDATGRVEQHPAILDLSVVQLRMIYLPVVAH